MDAHQCVCPELVVECPYARIGCDKRKIRQCELHSDREKDDLYPKSDKAQVVQLTAELAKQKAESKKRFRAIGIDVNIVKSSQCSSRTKLALNSIQTQLMTKLDLSSSGKPLVLHMTKYSEYQ